MRFEQFILPGNRGWSLVAGESDVLLQEVEGGVMLHEVKCGKLVHEKILEEIAAERAAEFEYLAEAEGGDLFHCFFIGFRHTPEFVARVAAFRRDAATFFFAKVRVTFYAKR